MQHEGVDVALAKPAPDAVFTLRSGRTLGSHDEVVTFAARNLEPLRGHHIFMRAPPRIMAERPRAEILIIGGSGTTYGALPPDGESWKARFFKEIAGSVDTARIHFTGHLAHHDYLSALQISSAHVYLTYPFVLSWSLLEAMSVGCLVVGSDTAPVREVIENNHNGLLVPFVDRRQLAGAVVGALAQRDRHRAMRNRARQTVLDRFDVEGVCLPKMLAFIRGTLSTAAAPPPRARRTRLPTPA